MFNGKDKEKFWSQFGIFTALLGLYCLGVFMYPPVWSLYVKPEMLTLPVRLSFIFGPIFILLDYFKIYPYPQLPAFQGLNTLGTNPFSWAFFLCLALFFSYGPGKSIDKYGEWVSIIRKTVVFWIWAYVIGSLVLILGMIFTLFNLQF